MPFCLTAFGVCKFGIETILFKTSFLKLVKYCLKLVGSMNILKMVLKELNGGFIVILQYY